MCIRDSFDGYAFANYTTHDGLPDRRISDICETSEGILFVATASGLCRLEPRGHPGAALFAYVPLGDDPKTNEVNDLLADASGAVWVATEGGLYWLQSSDGTWTGTRIETGSDGSVMALAADLWGGLWLCSDNEARLRWPDGRVDRYSLAGTALGGAPTLKVDRDGTLWIGTRLGVGRSAPRPSADTPLAISEVRPDKAAGPWGWGNAFLRSRDGTMWLGMNPGLWRVSNETFTRQLAIDEVCDRTINDLAEDRDGNLWLATSCGAIRIDRYGFSSYSVADGLTEKAVVSVATSANADVIVTTRAVGPIVHRFDGVRFHAVAPNVPKAAYYGWGWGQTIMQDHEGAWWVPTQAGLHRYPRANWPEEALRARPESIYSDAEVFRVMEDSRGDVWFATVVKRRLFRWERATGRVIDQSTVSDIGSESDITALAETRDGAIWVGTGNGELFRFRNAHHDRMTGADGVPVGWIRALYVDDLGRLWIASSRGGLARVENPTGDHPVFASYTMRDGLASDNIWSIVSDSWGRIYVGTPRGVDRLDLATGRIKHYTPADGLEAGSPQCAVRDRAGRLWFGSQFGLSRLDPEPERPREPPRTLVTGLRAAGIVQPVSALGEMKIPSFEVGPGESSVSVEFLGLAARLGEDILYQYRLDGAAEDWTAPAAERTVTFASLAPGSYRFLVRAIDSEGVVSPDPAEVAFTVLAPVWQRWWFLALVAVILCGAAFAFYRYRVAQLLAIERVRTRISTDLHDDIGANLTRIAILSEVAKYRLAEEPASAGDPLSSIARISRESVASMSDIVWAINPKKDSVDDLVSRMRRLADETFASRGIELDFRGPEHERALKLGHETRRQVFLFFKEAVTNVLRHSECARVEIVVSADRSRLTVSVADDGRGFDTGESSEGNGLESMQKRARALFGECSIESAPGRGTTVTLSVPPGAGWRAGHPVHMDS